MSHAKGILEAEEVEFLLESGNTNGKQHSATGGTQQVVTMRGDLEQIQLADIFQTLATAKMEGVLAVHNPIEQRQVYFHDGHARVLVSQRTANRRIGQRLIAANLINTEDLRKALVLQRKQQTPLGEILIQSGHVTEEQLDDILAQQIEEELYGLFTWEHGEFEFYRGPCTDQETIDRLAQSPRFPINSLLLEVARRSDEWEDILTAIGSLDEIPIMVAGVDPETLTEPHRTVLLSVDGKTSFRGLGDQAMLMLFECARAARDLVKQGAIQGATNEQLIEAAGHHLELGHNKNALMIAHTLRSREGVLPLNIVRDLATILRSCNEGDIACLVALEAAQQQTDPRLALDLAREACAHNPRDLVAMSFLRTTMMAHLPPDSPELLSTTLALLDGLIGDGEADHVLTLVEEIEQHGTKSPDILLRQARALAKKKDINEAVSVFVAAAQAFGANGERNREIEAYDLALRLDRNRKEIRRVLRQLQMTPRKRLMHFITYGAACVTLITLVSMWISASMFEIRLNKATAEIAPMLLAGNYQEARKANARWLLVLGNTPESATLEESIQLAESREVTERNADFRRRSAQRLHAAGTDLEAGRIVQACSIYNEIAASEVLHIEAIEAAEARCDALTRTFEAAGKTLGSGMPPPPGSHSDREQLAMTLSFLRQHASEECLLAAKELLTLNEKNQLVLPVSTECRRRVLDAARQALPMIDRGHILLLAYENVAERNDTQRRLDPLFKAAIDHEAKLEFHEALDCYRKLLIAKAGNKDLISHFEARVESLALIVAGLDRIETATKANDFPTAQQQLTKLQQLAPKVPFDAFVRMPVTLMTSMPGAAVTWNGNPIGTTPCDTSFIRGANNEITAVLPRFVPARINLPQPARSPVLALLTLQHDGEAELSDAVDQPFAIGNDGIACGIDRSGKVFAIDLATRQLRWRMVTGDTAGFLSTPLLREREVIVASLDGTLRALDRSTGKLLWQHADLATEHAPTLINDRIALATTRGALVLVDAVTGIESQRSTLSSAACGDLLTIGSRLFIPLQNGDVEAHDGRSLEMLWRAGRGTMGQSLSVSAGFLVSQSDDGKVCVRDAVTGTIAWQKDLAGSPIGRLASDAHSLLITLDERLVLLDVRNGQEIWHTVRPEAGFLAAAQLLGNRIAAPMRDGSILVFASDQAAPRFQLEGDRKNTVLGIDAKGRVLLCAGRKVATFRNLP